MTKVLITGGAGFIGLHLAQRLLAQGYDVVLAENFFKKDKKDADLDALLAHQRLSLIEADLTDPAAWETLGSGYDHVYHLAAINGTGLFYTMPHEVLRINTLTTIYALEWFRTKNPKGKIMFTSSNEAYAGALSAFGQLPLPTPENVPHVIADTYNPRWSYAATKLIGELFFIHYAKQHNFRMVIVRPHNFYGPRAGTKHVIPEFIERIEKRTDPFPIYGGDDTRTFCYIDDAVEAMQMVMESEKTDGGTYHIGHSVEHEIEMQKLAEELFAVAGWKPKEITVQNGPAGSVKRRAPDISKIQAHVGWEPKTSLREGLKKTYEWYTKGSLSSN